MTIQSSAAGAPSLDQFRRWTHLMGRCQQLMLEQVTNQANGAPKALPLNPDPFGLMSAWSALAAGLAADPARLVQVQADWWSDSLKLWQSFLYGTPADAPPPRDRRFAAPDWQDNPAFRFLRQSYLLASQHLLSTMQALDGIDPKEKEKALFYTRQFIDAMSPSNFAATNPEVLRATIETGGENLIRGLEHMLDDLARGRMRMTDEQAFEVGRNVAATPGKVVYENRLFQLIQYAPATEQVHEVPLVIFPPWINKFYILDLTPEKSFIRWATEQGLTVFVVSWRNADESLADVLLDDYVREGQIEAIDRAREASGADSVHAIGYCVAGTTLAATLAYLTAKGEAQKVRTATFFTAQVDFTEAGDLSVFIDDQQIAAYRALSEGKGYLDGRYMATTFNLLRSNDLIWNYVVNNYLLGKDYIPFDLLYWNSDPTNVPARWHQQYLCDLYRDNRLAQPGGVSVAGVPIDLRTVATPSYVQAGREDHIAPPASVYKITGHFSGPVRFVLAGSGHIAGVVNHPASGKYQYWTADSLPDSLDGFIAAAKETKGSWWPDWAAWLKPQSGPLRPARIPGDGPLKAIEDAPGRYVRERI